MFPLLCLRSHLQHGFNTWPLNFHMLWSQPKKIKKKKWRPLFRFSSVCLLVLPPLFPCTALLPLCHSKIPESFFFFFNKKQIVKTKESYRDYLMSPSWTSSFEVLMVSLQQWYLHGIWWFVDQNDSQFFKGK